MKRWILGRRILFASVVVLLILLALFVINGLLLSNGETAIGGVTKHAAQKPADPTIVTIMAYNIAKGFAYQGGLSFADAVDLRKRMEGIADLVRAENPDFVFLSEALTECTPSPVDQVALIAERADMHCWAFGENFNFGLPFYRMISGNAILARGPLTPVANPSLAGRQPFYVPKNNRRVLWCESTIGAASVLLASIHNDSFNLKNNRLQMQQILDYAKDGPAILAGDFNAEPHNESIRLIADSKRFTAVMEEPRTYPSDKPRRRIDFIFAPANWTLLEHRVVDSVLSDHKPVVCRFRLPSLDK